MITENIDYLRLHIHHWHTLRDAGYIQNVSAETAEKLLLIAQGEFDPRYLICLRHAQNICGLIKYVYTQAADILDSESAEVTETLIIAGCGEEQSYNEKGIAVPLPGTGKIKRRQKGGQCGNKIFTKRDVNAMKLAGREVAFWGRPPPGKCVALWLLGGCVCVPFVFRFCSFCVPFVLLFAGFWSRKEWLKRTNVLIINVLDI